MARALLNLTENNHQLRKKTMRINKITKIRNVRIKMRRNRGAHDFLRRAQIPVLVTLRENPLVGVAHILGSATSFREPSGAVGVRVRAIPAISPVGQNTIYCRSSSSEPDVLRSCAGSAQYTSNPGNMWSIVDMIRLPHGNMMS